MPTRSLSITFTTLAYAVFLASGTHAATITGGGIMSSISAPGSGSVSSSVRVSRSPTLLKFVGDLNLSTTTGGTSVGNTLDIGGSLTLDPQDVFLVSYDFDVLLVGGGTVNLTTTGTTNFGGITQTISNTETITTSGNFNFRFSELGTVATEAQSGTWSGQLSFDWIDATAGSSLNITIPNDSIDFEVAAIPEPSSMALALLSGLLVFSRRRA